LDEAEQNRHRDGGVTDEKKPGENARGKCELRRQLLVVQTERLEKARSTVGQMKGEQEQPHNVERGDVNILKPVNHHRVNIVMVERIVLQQRKVRVELTAGKMQEMKNDEGEHNQPAHDHVARSVARPDVIPFLVALRAGTPVIEREADSKINVEENRN